MDERDARVQRGRIVEQVRDEPPGTVRLLVRPVKLDGEEAAEVRQDVMQVQTATSS